MCYHPGCPCQLEFGSLSHEMVRINLRHTQISFSDDGYVIVIPELTNHASWTPALEGKDCPSQPPWGISSIERISLSAFTHQLQQRLSLNDLSSTIAQQIIHALYECQTIDFEPHSDLRLSVEFIL